MSTHQTDERAPAEHGNFAHVDTVTHARRRAEVLAQIESALPANEGSDTRWLKRLIERCALLSADAELFALDRAATLAGIKADLGTITASLVLALPTESVDAALSEVPESLGQESATLLAGCRKVIGRDWQLQSHNSDEDLRRMFAAMASDMRVILISLADRCCVMHRLRSQPEHSRDAVARETMAIFAPLANRIGIWQLKWQLEDLSLRQLQPEVYKQLSKLLEETRDQRNQHVEEVTTILSSELNKAGISGSIKGRPKHIYSIYGKMKRKQVGFDEIYDVTAVRVIVDALAECYAVLGLVHGMWSPIPGEFDDYIAQPKGNMYQSLHTAVVGPNGKPLEVQIRTQAMHEFAEFGVAAHWAYKEGGRGTRADRLAERQFDLMHQLMDWQSKLGEHDSVDAELQTELFKEQVYVFTPSGEIIALPRGATALDFAYRIHTMVGHRCRGARIDNEIKPLHTKLETGQHIEILTRKQPAPSRDWLNPHSGFVHTQSARHKIKHWFRQQGRGEALEQGRLQLITQFEKFDLALPEHLDAIKESAVNASPAVSRLAERFEFKNAADLLVAIGFGDMSAHRVAASEAQRLADSTEDSEPIPETNQSRSNSPRRASASGVSIAGTSDIMSQPASCCRPIPGDAVVGYISRGRGVVIHRRDCPNLAHHQEPERLLDVDWGSDSRKSYPIRLAIRVHDRRGALKQITEVIALQNTSIADLHTRRDDRDEIEIDCTLDISTQDQLLRVMSRLEHLDFVHSVHRRGH